MGLFGKKKGLVGVDVGSSAIKAVELKVGGKGRDEYQLLNIGIEPLPPEAIVDGAIMDSGAVIDAIQRLFQENRIKTADVATGVCGNAVIVKKISLPQMSPDELAESIHWEAEQYIPFDIQDVNLDYQILESGADGRNSMEVLLVAAKKERIVEHTNVIAQAGRDAVVVDVDAFALQNAYEANYGAGPLVTVLLNAGASAINVNIVSEGQSHFTRDVSLGGNAYTEAVQRELDLPFDAAERAKKGIAIEGHTFDEVRPVLHAVTENVLLEIQKTFDFYRATAPSDRIDRMVLTGGSSAIDGFAEALSERFGIPVERFDPFRQVVFDGAMNEANVDLAATAGVAVGLALRKAGDR